jgi:hypothetical protein
MNTSKMDEEQLDELRTELDYYQIIIEVDYNLENFAISLDDTIADI